MRLHGDAAMEPHARLEAEGVHFRGQRVAMDEFEHVLRPWDATRQLGSRFRRNRNCSFYLITLTFARRGVITSTCSQLFAVGGSLLTTHTVRTLGEEFYVHRPGVEH